MSLGINTNIASLSAQRALSNTQADAATAMQRLSSGLRINSAKDDAAGLAVSNALTSRIQGLNQASRNANDAVSMLQTAEGGLQAVTDSLQRMRELAVQAASDSIGSVERGYLDTEFQQLITEIDRIVDASSYNSVQLLDGSFSSKVFQVGANNSSTNDRITISIADSNTAALGTSQSTYSLTGAALAGSISDGDLTIKVGTNGTVTDIGAVSATGTTNFAANVKAAVEAANSAVTATVGGATLALGDFTGNTGGVSGDDTVAMSVTNGATTVALFGATDITNVTAVTIDAAIADSTVAANLSAAGITVSGSASNGDLTFSNSDGKNLVFTQTIVDANTSITAFGFDKTSTTATESETAYGSITLTASDTLTLAGNGTVNAGFHANNLTDTTSGGTAVSALDVLTTTAAQTAISSLDNALSTVNSTRASIGSYQSAFDTMIANLSVESENASSARSRILDADFAQESAALAKTQVLQQAGISVLAQANAMPQQVLALLQ